MTDTVRCAVRGCPMRKGGLSTPPPPDAVWLCNEHAGDADKYGYATPTRQRRPA